MRWREDGVSVQGLSVWSLAPQSAHRREPPRPPELRQPGYDEVYDYDTLLYDVFRDAKGRRVLAVGPPLHNLLGVFEQMHVSAGPRRLDRALLLRDRNMQIWIDGAAEVEAVVFSGEELQSPSLKVGDNRCALFEGRRVVVAISKENDLAWIADWARFYERCHGATGLLLYDNGSKSYGCDDIRAAVAASAPGLQVEIVSWPFRFGARGGPAKRWDSDYCQYGILEHARHKYLQTASSVLNCDIDELVVSAGGKSIFEVTETKRRGYTAMSGVVMPNNFDPERPGPRRFMHYRYSERGSVCPNKWCVVPAKCGVTQQWKIHGVTGFSTEPDKGEFVYRHFRGINTSWTFNRSRPEPILSRHSLDQAWIRSLERAFGDEAEAGHVAAPSPRLP